MMLAALALAAHASVATPAPVRRAGKHAPAPAAVSATAALPSSSVYGPSATVLVPPTTDRWGIRMLNPTIPGGREWYSKWDNGNWRRFEGRDPDDPELDSSRGDGNARANGRGLCLIDGPAPRLDVTDPEGIRTWGNVEITVYGMRISETETVTGAGLQAYARTGFARRPGACENRAYGARILYDGRANFVKLVSSDDPEGSVRAETRQVWQRKMRPWLWVGMKFVVRNVTGGVRLELWRDRKNGRDGGYWQKLGEWTDRGAWGAGAQPCAPGVDPEEILGGAAPSVYLVNYGVEDMRYKWFSVREIPPEN